MRDNTKQISFENQKDSKAQFDLLRLEDLYKRKDIHHSIEENHRVNFFIIIFIEEGNGYHTINFKDYECSKGTLLTIRKNQVHKFFRSNNLKGSLILFTDQFLVSYLEEMEEHKTMLLFNEQIYNPKIKLNHNEFKNINEIFERINDEYFKLNDNYSLTIVRSELHILITKLFRIKESQSKINFDKKYLKQFIKIQNTAEKKVSQNIKIKDLAYAVGLSTKTLNSITKNIVNKSAKEFVDDISIRYIKRLLINTELSIKEIAYKTGFEETTNFYKYFKRITQTTPEKFRASFL